MRGIAENINSVKQVIAECAASVGRDVNDITLVAVTKTHAPQMINEAIRNGVTDIGENRVQEILEKYNDVMPVNWHMIGHLQRNKVKYIIDKVKMIHSVDSLRLAEEIDLRAGELKIKMDILIQINPAEEESKFGVKADSAGGLLVQILENCKNLRVCGLMCVVPFAEEPENVRGFFKEAKKRYDSFKSINHERLALQYLSMGMSGDYSVAIEEGSNMVRVGTAIFGNR